ncbi:MAG: glycosyltransferase, partial [Caulobacteraceae bacterium]
TAHKGYPLIYAALQQGGFDNLELTIVDHELSSGEEHQVWGSTPVRIIPRAPQASVPQIYAEMDVLLAPSTWPESFGLVTREALASGLWVVASNLGAMGEDVEPDVNGFLIDVSSPDDLKAVLGRISADPSRYLASPKPSRASRSTEDQAADLADIYRGIVGAKADPALVASPGVEAVG